MVKSKCKLTKKGGSSYMDPEVGTGGTGPPPLKNYKNIGFLSNTGPDPLKIIKLPSQHLMLGHQNAI